MARFKLVNGERIAYTAEEEAARDAEEAAAKAYKDANGYKEDRRDFYPPLLQMQCIGIVREIRLN